MRGASAWAQTHCVTQGSCFSSLSLSFLVYKMGKSPLYSHGFPSCGEGYMRGSESGKGHTQADRWPWFSTACAMREGTWPSLGRAQRARGAP